MIIDQEILEYLKKILIVLKQIEKELGELNDKRPTS